MYLVGDIGNTETKICLFNKKKKLLIRKAINTNNINMISLNKHLMFLKNNQKKIDKVIFSSVVPNTYKKIKNYIEKKFQLKVKEIKQFNLKKILKIEVNMNQIGSDRIANALGVINNKNNFIVLDFGTATTFDVVVKNCYKGGIIAPGVNLSLKTLSSNAKLIPIIKLLKIKKIIGKNTKSAVRSGFYWGYQGLIENIINMIEKETKKKYKIIFTGGLSDLFKNSLKQSVKINRDLTIKGLLKLIN